MANRDGTGPEEKGPMTGRQMGNCEGAKPTAGRGRGNRSGAGRGRRMGNGRGFANQAD